MPDFGKRGQSEEKLFSQDFYTRNSFEPEETHFDAHWPKYISVIGALFLSFLIYVTQDMSKSDIIYVLPMVGICIAVIIFYIGQLFKHNFTIDQSQLEINNAAKYPLVAVLGIFGGLIYGMVSTDTGVLELFAIDWVGELLETPMGNADDPVSWAIMEYMGFGGCVALFLAASIDRVKDYLFNKDAG